ncbi:MAG: Tryptophanyl-tRNA synthetase [Candidatus Rifleibacterium amylolyticum]|nr:MAG: Tryptophanyl-tRNA synthetase [Candidatus Rifleibacterium amylolyticum]
MAKKRLVSGMRTTGSLHLGHLEGTLKNWVSLQDTYDCYFFAAVWHAFTDRLKIDNLPAIIREMIVDWLSVGIDPEKAVIFRQSAMHEHAELATILANCTPLGWLERCPTFKDAVRDDDARSGVSLGKLMYPVLMTADIAVYNAEAVPVGKDQLPHLELSREIIRRFNGTFGEVLKEPEAVLSQVPLLIGIDKRKMSKSYNNGIDLRETPENLKSKIQQMITDPQRVRRNDPGDPEVCTVFAYHKIYTPDRLDEIAEGCRTAALGCRDCKLILFERLNAMLEPIRQRRLEIESRKGYIEEVLDAGEKRAHLVASEVMQNIRQVMGFLL